MIADAFRSIERYWLRHWQGQYPLPVAFWLNFAALNVALYFIQRTTRYLIGVESARLFWIVLVEFVVFRLIVFPWQFVGLVRTCDRELKKYGNSHWPRAAQLVAALGVLVVILDGLETVRAGYTYVARGARVPPVQSRDYQLTLGRAGSVIHLRGYLDIGVTRDLRQLLSDHPEVTAVILDSDGGPVYEARGVAKLIGDRGLDTYSIQGCSSACVTAFAGGRQRWLAPRARLGFHSYRLDMTGPLPHIDEQEELHKDLAFYESRGIDVSFLGIVAETPASDIWYPRLSQLLQSGFVHGVATPPPAGIRAP